MKQSLLQKIKSTNGTEEAADEDPEMLPDDTEEAGEEEEAVDDEEMEAKQFSPFARILAQNVAAKVSFGSWLISLAAQCAHDDVIDSPSEQRKMNSCSLEGFCDDIVFVNPQGF